MATPEDNGRLSKRGRLVLALKLGGVWTVLYFLLTIALPGLHYGGNVWLMVYGLLFYGFAFCVIIFLLSLFVRTRTRAALFSRVVIGLGVVLLLVYLLSNFATE